jgi:N-acetylglutamate synthase/N-acetylornithine aminotransferase
VAHGVIPPAYFAPGDLQEAAAAAMRGSEVSLRVSIGHGPGSTRVLGGDLSHDYLKINGEYTT